MNRSPGQTALLQALRVHGNEEMGTLVERSDVDDLEWFALMLELQLEEAPHWVKDKNQLHETQAWYRRVRTMVLGILHNKRIRARKHERILAIGRDVGLVVLGALIGWALASFSPSMP